VLLQVNIIIIYFIPNNLYNINKLLVSDSCFNKTATDTSGSFLKEEIIKVYHVDEKDIKYDVIPDDCNKIEVLSAFNFK